MILLKYVGGSRHKTVTVRRKERYFFTRENGYILDLEEEIVNYIFDTQPGGQFNVVKREVPKEEKPELKKEKKYKK